jgi:hypothetical protein
MPITGHDNKNKSYARTQLIQHEDVWQSKNIAPPLLILEQMDAGGDLQNHGASSQWQEHPLLIV